jgi:hypothetical protein
MFVAIGGIILTSPDGLDKIICTKNMFVTVGANGTIQQEYFYFSIFKNDDEILWWSYKGRV